MKSDDLTQVKHIGPSRMKLLNDSGIHTFRQIYEMPLEKLARIKLIGKHYAGLIKDAVTEYYGANHEKGAAKTMPEEKMEEVNRNLRKQLGVLKKRLKQANEDLKPLGKKKHLEVYINFKKRSQTLKTRINVLDQVIGDLSKKVKKKILKKTDVLNAMVKNIGKKPKKKKYMKLSEEIQSLSKQFKRTGS